MTAADWVKIALAILGLLGAAGVYVFQRRVDRLEAIRNERKTAYRDFLHALFEHADERTEETRKAYDRSKIAMLMVAPDSIVKRLVPVQEMATMDMDATGPGDVHDVVIDLIIAMRNDCFDSSELNASELDYVVPIGKPTPLTAEPEGHFEP